jgi:H+/gluconate symporter-like permease
MTHFLGSQFGIIVFLIIGGIVVYIINSFRKEKMSEETAESIFNGFGGIGIIVMIVCFVLYECSHAS